MSTRGSAIAGNVHFPVMREVALWVMAVILDTRRSSSSREEPALGEAELAFKVQSCKGGVVGLGRCMGNPAARAVGENTVCEWGDTVPVMVTIPADLSSTGKAKLKKAQIDRCIAPIIDALELGKVFMRGCCCGHGKAPGFISLQDGRTIFVGFPANSSAGSKGGELMRTEEQIRAKVKELEAATQALLAEKEEDGNLWHLDEVNDSIYALRWVLGEKDRL